MSFIQGMSDIIWKKQEWKNKKVQILTTTLYLVVKEELWFDLVLRNKTQTKYRCECQPILAISPILSALQCIGTLAPSLLIHYSILTVPLLVGGIPKFKVIQR